jgi:hypothetical protein
MLILLLLLLLQANTFTLAGYETTANALAFSLWCIATHPEAEAKLLQEAAAATQPFHTYSRDMEQQVGTLSLHLLPTKKGLFSFVLLSHCMACRDYYMHHELASLQRVG